LRPGAFYLSDIGRVSYFLFEAANGCLVQPLQLVLLGHLRRLLADALELLLNVLPDCVYSFTHVPIFLPLGGCNLFEQQGPKFSKSGS
jgi:hypothetical protein